MVTNEDIGKLVAWHDVDLRLERTGILKGVSADGMKGYVITQQRRPGSPARHTTRSHFVTVATDELRVVENEVFQQ